MLVFPLKRIVSSATCYQDLMRPYDIVSNTPVPLLARETLWEIHRKGGDRLSELADADYYITASVH